MKFFFFCLPLLLSVEEDAFVIDDESMRICSTAASTQCAFCSRAFRARTVSETPEIIIKEVETQIQEQDYFEEFSKGTMQLQIVE